MSDDTDISTDTTEKYLKECVSKFKNTIDECFCNSNDYTIRDKNLNMDNDPFFGIISKNMAETGVYSDLSLVIFPGDKKNNKWVISLAVGTGGYQNDYLLAGLPGTKRLFLQLRNKDLYVKNNFHDLNTNFISNIKIMKEECDSKLYNTLKRYGKYILACKLMGGYDEKDVKLFLALYAKIRDWDKNTNIRNNIKQTLKDNVNIIEDDDKTIKELLLERKYIVLQGAPGTGKTHTAKKIAIELTNNKDNIFFTQFHAETTYGDFIYCIKPALNSAQLTYNNSKGILLEAIEKAKNIGHNEIIVLIIDEINRANLSNVLGESLYLFEKNLDDSVKIKIGSETLSKLPDNLFIIATMNTADRSLAIIDFALRRRFAWYTLKPRLISSIKEKYAIDCFNDMNEIFIKYASDEELNLQPGQSYFIANSKEEMNNKLKYELLPLIHEYLNEGLMPSAKDAFETYFREHIEKGQN